jgi:hypothetical protein
MNELWSEDFEVMHWVIERFERAGPRIEVGEVLRVFPEEQYDRMIDSVRRLSSHSYLVCADETGLRTAVSQPSAAAPALRLIEELPDEELPDNAEVLADRLLAVLVEGAVHEPDPERRFKLEAGLRGIGGLTRDVLVDVVAAALARSTPITHSWLRPYETVSQNHS